MTFLLLVHLSGSCVVIIQDLRLFVKLSVIMPLVTHAEILFETCYKGQNNRTAWDYAGF
jgi:hypothetical protein